VTLWGSTTASNLADGLFQVGLPLLALTLTRSPGLIAAVTFAAARPAERPSSCLAEQQAVSRWQVAPPPTVMVAKRRRRCPREICAGRLPMELRSIENRKKA
jgi:hypothetical protein